MKCISHFHSLQDGQGSKVSSRDQNLDSLPHCGLQSQSTKQSVLFCLSARRSTPISLPFPNYKTPPHGDALASGIALPAHALACLIASYPDILISSYPDILIFWYPDILMFHIFTSSYISSGIGCQLPNGTPMVQPTHAFSCWPQLPLCQ